MDFFLSCLGALESAPTTNQTHAKWLETTAGGACRQMFMTALVYLIKTNATKKKSSH